MLSLLSLLPLVPIVIFLLLGNKNYTTAIDGVNTNLLGSHVSTRSQLAVFFLAALACMLAVGYFVFHTTLMSDSGMHTTVNSLCNDCFDYPKSYPYIQLSLLRGTTAVRKQWSVTNGVVLTSRVSLH